MKCIRILKNFIPVVVYLFLMSNLAYSDIEGLEDHIILPQAERKILILEFDYPGKTNWGKEISQLIAQQILSLLDDKTGARVIIWRQPFERPYLNLEKIKAIAAEQKAAVVIWGEVYSDGSNSYVSPHLRIIHQGSGLELSLRTTEGFVKAGIPTYHVNFASTPIPEQLIKAIESNYSEAMDDIYAFPDPGSQKIDTPKPEGVYSILQTVNGWIQIEVQDKVQRDIIGWIPNTTEGIKFPDLRAASQLAVGILQYFSGSFELAERTFVSYLAQYEQQNAMIKALANVLLGHSRLRLIDPLHLSAEERVSETYIKAAELIPDYASPINNLAIVNLIKYGKENRYVPQMRSLERKLVQVVKQQNDADSASNLTTLYKLAKTKGFLKDEQMSDSNYKDAVSKQLNVLAEVDKQIKVIESNRQAIAYGSVQVKSYVNSEVFIDNIYSGRINAGETISYKRGIGEHNIEIRVQGRSVKESLNIDREKASEVKMYFRKPILNPPAPQPVPGSRLPKEIIGKDGTRMVLIPAGDFLMGSKEGEDSEKPLHEIYLDALYMDVYEVTNEQYRKFIDANKEHSEPMYWNDERFNDPNQPVVGVSWDDAVAYCRWAGKRLPTEAEWEKAARGGLKGMKYSWGNTITEKDANYDGRDRWTATAPVGSFKPNGYGLYDMVGNAYEWCADWFEKDYYKKSPRKNPQGPESGGERVLRGGSFYDTLLENLRVSFRNEYPPEDIPSSELGFRCVADINSLNIAPTPHWIQHK